MAVAWLNCAVCYRFKLSEIVAFIGALHRVGA